MTTWQENLSDCLRPGRYQWRETVHAGQLDDHRHCGERRPGGELYGEPWSGCGIRFIQ